MLEWAGYLLWLSLSCLIATLIILVVDGRSAVSSSYYDKAAEIIFGISLASSIVAQPLLAFDLHHHALSAWRMVCLYFTAVIVFFSGVLIAIDFAGSCLRLSRRPDLPERVVDASLILFALCWLAEQFLVATR